MITVNRVAEPETEVISGLADGRCSAIAVLVNQGLEPKDADAVTLGTLIAIQAASRTSELPGPLVVAELTDDKHAHLATFAGAHQTVSRSGLLGDAIALAATSPEANHPRRAQRPNQTPGKARSGPRTRPVGDHPFATITARALEHGLLAVSTRSPATPSRGLRLSVRCGEIIQLARDDQVVTLLWGVDRTGRRCRSTPGHSAAARLRNLVTL